MTNPTVSPWDLWVQRALDPEAGPPDVIERFAERARQSRREQELLARIVAGDRSALEPAHDLLEARPEIRRGLLLTMHLGPYQLILLPLLEAGLDVTMLVNAQARRRLEPQTQRHMHLFDIRGTLDWVVAENVDCVRRLLRGLRADNGVVIAFADGNQGRGGLAGTRAHGVPYRLPGREILVRTGLARLICRTGCPVHPLTVRWAPNGRDVEWRPQPTQRWSRRDDPVGVTHRLFDWVFSEIQASPLQWSYWEMLGETAACFASGPDPHRVSDALVDDFRRAFVTCQARAPRTVRVELETAVEVWPGEILVDRTRDRFFAAEGLRDVDLDPLRHGAPTLADLTERHGRAWVDFHVLRLCLLGLARLGGDVAHAAV